MNRRLVVYLLRRLGQGAIIIAGILVLNFVLLSLAPGDAAEVMAGEAGGADPAYLERLRAQFGLDVPAPQRFLNYVLKLASFDLGHSPRYGISTTELILGRLPPTLLLMGASLTIAIALGIVLGVAAARRPGSVTDEAISLFSLLLYATPLFWVGLMLMLFFSVHLGWLPTGGMQDLVNNPRGFAWAIDRLRHLVLPSVTLSLFFLAIYTRLVRASVIEVYTQDYVKLARAKGVSERRVAYGHVLRNALMPLVTMVGVQVGALMGGSILVESVFAWPGLGRLAFEAVASRDQNLLLSILLVSSIFVVICNLVVDLLYLRLDPRIELR
ncbi:ABC transporter permease [Humitalea sp. 24SJ18S-53]|uniref:ABC transporter permease n=1 Tax=Humitalea sp. 24SJ18S-53 TaxID=3422307 RepID=UPI003D67BBEE